MSRRSGVYLCVEEKTAGARGVVDLEMGLALKDIEIRELKPLVPGSDKRQALHSTLSLSSAALLVVSRALPRRAAEESRWTQLQIEAISKQADHGLKVVPILMNGAIEADLPMELSHHEHVRLDSNAEQKWNSEFERLLEAIRPTEETEHNGSLGPSLYFTSLEIENLRCFRERQKLELAPRWNVILGDNGTGKTTLLRALASFSPRVEPSWIGSGAGQATFLGEGGSTVVALGQKAQLIYGYGAGRGANTGPVELADARADTCETLFNEVALLPDPQEWILQTDYAEKLRNGKSTAESHKDIPLKRLKNILCNSILPDVYDLEPTVSNDGIPLVVARTPYGVVPLKDLSFGYRTAMSWIIDLAGRLFRRYPVSDDPLSEHAILLVDEIDLHLHPRWQRQLLKVLNDTFTKTQFIVTAHSPLIVQAAPQANLTLLRQEGDQVVIHNDVDYVRKWRVDQILASELFGEQPTHAPEVERLFEEMIELKSKPKLTADERARLDQVDAELDELPTAANPSDIRAMEIIRKAAARLEQ